MAHKLTLKRQRFRDAYLEHGNATKAAIAAGCTEKSAGTIGHRMLKDPKVAAAIAAAEERAADMAGVTRSYVLSTIKDTVERCRALGVVRDRKGAPVLVPLAPEGEKVIDSDGKPVTVAALVTFDPMAVLKGTEQLARILKMGTEEGEGSGGTTVNVINLTVDL